MALGSGSLEVPANKKLCGMVNRLAFLCAGRAANHVGLGRSFLACCTRRKYAAPAREAIRVRGLSECSEVVVSNKATISQYVSNLAVTQGDARAFSTSEGSVSWRAYDEAANELARALVHLGVGVGDRVGVLLPDGPGVHVAFLAIERAGAVIVGAGARSGVKELVHLFGLTQCTALISAAEHQGLGAVALRAELAEADVSLTLHLIVDSESGRQSEPLSEAAGMDEEDAAARRHDPDDIWLLNSTSGTTGMPKCVVHDQSRWFAFHDFAVEAGQLDQNDVFMSVVPAPFGFGIWTAHVTPVLLGVPTVLMTGFDAGAALELIEQHRVTVLAAVSTQFIMMLNSAKIDSCDLSSLRVLFTGGEAVPRDRASVFEEKTGAKVLQFYGSNEVGAVSRTTLDDSSDRRWTTAGRVIKEMKVRLFDEQGADVTHTGRGQPGCLGPTLSQGYYGDPQANAKLYRDDGWMMLGDIVTIDDEGYLTVVGRTDDFIIRGGKNISAAAVEEQVGTHPRVAHVGVVAMPDPVFGERVCAFVELDGRSALDLNTLCAYLREHGTSKEYLPEHLVVLDALPRAAGGKIAKAELCSHVAALSNKLDSATCTQGKD